MCGVREVAIGLKELGFADGRGIRSGYGIIDTNDHT
jgi:hypothetical protein